MDRELMFLLDENTKERLTEQLCTLMSFEDISKDNDEIRYGEIQELIGILDDGLQYVWEDELDGIPIHE